MGPEPRFLLWFLIALFILIPLLLALFGPRFFERPTRAPNVAPPTVEERRGQILPFTIFSFPPDQLEEGDSQG
jgi:hypothetical protein